MKHRIILIMLMVFCLCSCTDNDIQFSCDEETDSWVRDHLTEIHTMNRNSWLSSEQSLAIPMYRAFSQAQKIAFWVDKIEEVKLLNWTADEIAHLELVERFINEYQSLFRNEKLTEDENDIIDSFVFRWRKTAIENFGWTDDLIKSILASGRRVLDKSGNLQSLPNSKIRAILPMVVEPYCGCNTEHDFCPQEFECNSGNCTGVSTGCGWFLIQECDGRCDPDGIVIPQNQHTL